MLLMKRMAVMSAQGNGAGRSRNSSGKNTTTISGRRGSSIAGCSSSTASFGSFAPSVLKSSTFFGVIWDSVMRKWQGRIGGGNGTSKILGA